MINNSYEATGFKTFKDLKNGTIYKNKWRLATGNQL
jgi:hypothetical protein